MEKITRATFILGFLFLLSGCEKERADDCFRSHGDANTETRILPSFSRLHIEGDVAVRLIPASEPKTVVSGGSNFLSQIHTEVRDGTLYVEDNIGCKFVRSYTKPYSVDVYFTHLREIAHYGSKQLTSTVALNSPVLEIDKWAGGGDVILPVSSDSVFIRIHAGSGDVTITGDASFGYVYQRGFGFMFCEELALANAYIDKGGTGDCVLLASNQVTVDFNSPGDLIIHGNPFIDIRRKTGEGRVITLP
jgi:hypothetical protein